MTDSGIPISHRSPRLTWGHVWLVLAATLLSVLDSGPVAAQTGTQPRAVPPPVAVERTSARVPFGPGEWAEYEVRLGRLSVGRGSMEIERVESIRGWPSYHVSWKIAGGLPFLRVNDHMQSWIDVETLASRRFIQDIDEVRYERYSHYEIYPEEKRWQLVGPGDVEAFTTDRPLDDIAFIYYVRTLPLEVGQTYTLHQYFREDRNPVTIQVLRRERIEVPAGTFNTIVVQPIIKAGGLFGEGGRAEVYFTDDDRRLLVRLTTRGVPLLGDLSLHLSEIRHGIPLNRE